MEFTVDICNLCALKYLITFCTAVTKKMQNTMIIEEGTRGWGLGKGRKDMDGDRL